MLVLSRKIGESVYIGHDIKIVVTKVDRNGNVRLAISAPQEITIHREEVYRAIQNGVPQDSPDQTWPRAQSQV